MNEMKINKNAQRWWLILPLLLLLGGCSSTLRTGEEYGSFTPSGNPTQDVKRAINALEKMRKSINANIQRQEALFQDINRRLIALERASNLPAGKNSKNYTQKIPVLSPSISASVAPKVSPSVSSTGGGTGASTSQQKRYDKALNLLKRGKHKDAIKEFNALLDNSPDGELADDAYYWMSEARYVNREFQTALGGFRTVTSRFPNSPRVPEALLKIGHIQYDLGNYADAARTFRDVLKRFPDHDVVVSAETRLRRIEQTIQP